MELQKFPSDEVIALLIRLKPGDYVKVRWRDASGFRELSVPEEVYYTPKETVGRFYRLVDDHLILVNESGFGLHEGTTIPTGCVEKVKLIASRGSKTAKKTIIRTTPGKSGNVPVKILEHTIKVPA